MLERKTAFNCVLDFDIGTFTILGKNVYMTCKIEKG